MKIYRDFFPKGFWIHTSVIPFAVIIFFIFLFYGRILCGEILFATDILPYQLPEKMFIRDCFERGILPVVNPYILCGAPILENIDAGVLYPLNLLLLMGSPLFGFHLFIFVHYLLAACSMYLLLRKGFRLETSISLLGALSFSLGGYLWSMIANGFFRCAYLVPLFILGMLKLLDCTDGSGKSRLPRRSGQGIFLAIFSLTLLFYCGNFLEAYFAVFFAGVALIFTLLPLLIQRRAGESARLILKYVFVTVAACLLAAPQLLPTFISSLSSYRSGGIPLTEAQQWSFPLIRVVEYVLPFIFGARQNNGLCFEEIYTVEEAFSRTGSTPWADSLFVGLFIVLGAVLFLKSERNRKKDFLFFAFCLSFLLALGKFTPVYRIFYYIMPGFSMFRHPEKFMFWVNLWLIIIACLGLQTFLKGDEKAFTLFKNAALGLSLLLGILLLPLICIFLIYPVDFAHFFQKMGSTWNGEKIFTWQFSTLALSTIVSLLMLVAIKVFRTERYKMLRIFVGVTLFHLLFWSYRIDWTLQAETLKKINTWDEKLPDFDRRIWRVFSGKKFLYPIVAGDVSDDPFKLQKLFDYSSLTVNLPTLKKLRSILGFSPILRKDYMASMNFEDHPPERILDLLSVKFIAVHAIPAGAVPEGTSVILREDELDYVILENRDAVPRVKTYSSYILSSPDKFLEETFDEKRDIQKTFVIEKLPDNFDFTVNCSGQSGVKILEDVPGKTVLSVEGPAWLVFRDWHLPGWTCEDENGNILPIVKADGGLMAVFVNTGKETLTFSYLPPGLRAGSICMFAGIMLLTSNIFFRKNFGGFSLRANIFR